MLLTSLLKSSKFSEKYHEEIMKHLNYVTNSKISNCVTLKGMSSDLYLAHVFYISSVYSCSKIGLPKIQRRKEYRAFLSLMSFIGSMNIMSILPNLRRKTFMAILKLNEPFLIKIIIKIIVFFKKS